MAPAKITPLGAINDEGSEEEEDDDDSTWKSYNFKQLSNHLI